MKDVKILGDVIRIKLKEANLPIGPYILAENLFMLVLAAKASFILPFTDIPFTFQSLVIVLIGTVYGLKAGLRGIFFYLLMGAVGIPVFAGESAGYLYMLGNTGGFLIGFIPAIIVAAFFAEKEFDRNIKTSTILLLVSQIVIVAFGFIWLKFYLLSEVSLYELSSSLIPGLLIKTLIGVILLKMMWNYVLQIPPKKEFISDH